MMSGYADSMARQGWPLVGVEMSCISAKVGLWRCDLGFQHQPFRSADNECPRGELYVIVGGKAAKIYA